jgi:hypothetical protein
MLPVDKLNMLSKLKLHAVLSTIRLNEDPDYLVKIGEIINSLGLELIQVCESILVI